MGVVEPRLRVDLADVPQVRAAISDLSSGTIGYFCVRCHQQVGTQRGERRWQPLWERSQVAREGITCITCHRVAEEYCKVNGERRIVRGDINQPRAQYRPEFQVGEVIAQKDYYRVAPTPRERGNRIHHGVVKFDQIAKSEFCVSCHQVAVHPGIKLEVVWDQYRASPSLKKGIHVPGLPHGQGARRSRRLRRRT